jgi:hypothetical protein
MNKKHRNVPDLAIIRDILKDSGVTYSNTIPEDNIGYFAGFDNLFILIRPHNILIKTTWDSIKEDL